MNHVSIIAEVGSVHDGSFGNALKLCDLACEVGADAVKFQTHISEEETLRDAPAPSYFKGEPRYEYFQRTGFSLQQWHALSQHCENLGIEFISSPFSELAVQWLLDVGVKRMKVASGEVTNLPLLESLNKAGKPVLLSSGMSDWAELDQAVATLSDVDLTLMQCTSKYPCPADAVGLNVICEMQQRYQKPVGFSDHTQSNYAAFAAVMKGATCIEKHLTFSRKMYGSDAPLASEPDEFRELVQGVRELSVLASSEVDKDDVSDYQEMKQIFQKSVVAAQDIAAGTVLSADMFRYKKPGSGISAADYQSLVGKTLKVALIADELILPEHF